MKICYQPLTNRSLLLGQLLSRNRVSKKFMLDPPPLLNAVFETLLQGYSKEWNTAVNVVYPTAQLMSCAVGCKHVIVGSYLCSYWSSADAACFCEARTSWQGSQWGAGLLSVLALLSAVWSLAHTLGSSLSFCLCEKLALLFRITLGKT